MPLTLANIIAHGPSIIGAVGGSVGIVSGLAVFARRRLRLIVGVTQTNDQRRSWHTITIANRSDLSLSFRGLVLSWFITTPLGRLELNRAYQPDNERELVAIAPHGVYSFDIYDDGPGDDVWAEAQPAHVRGRATLRIYIVIPALGGGCWRSVRWCRAECSKCYRNGALRPGDPFP
ncbi:hypothetical protein [Sphingomonas faeni]|uniref:hypothetical protein n=1 Tax=Sphingomonas faeni TaxID=185950 RepID=UPI0027801111|nr:hypothetical protein [Sphingomonas faeni]MDQ0839522.1 hypothetical protein [Sphingomonas faeni]